MTTPHPSPRALFLVLEGIDGSGTTTQLDLLTGHLRARGRRVLPTREPSGGPIGRLLRAILLGQHDPVGDPAVDGRAMALLFAADRRDHLVREIEPALAAGSDVVSDRYVLSSLAYQPIEADRSWVERLADGIRMPDLTILLDVPIAVAAERRRRARRPSERYDADGTQQRVRENYRGIVSEAARWGEIAILDASGTVSEVQVAIAAQVDRLMDREGANS
jgi:dTMP kinase